MMKRRSFRREVPLLFAGLLIITFIASLSNNDHSTPRNHPWILANSTSLGSTSTQCDLFKGRWVKEERKSYYDNVKCPSLQDSKDCFKYGREDREFLHWRWKPDDCHVPALRPMAFLEMVRGTRMAFVGDSIARNQADSLACLLSQVEIPEVTYADKEDKCKTWFFQGHNFTISLLWTEFLDSTVEGPEYQPYTHSYNLHVDRVDPSWANKLPGSRYAVISTDHWWFRKNFVYKGNNLLGCYYCDQEKSRNTTDVGLEFTYREAIRTALRFIANCKECGDMLAVLRTFSPAHFEAGTWDKGGECNRTSPLEEEEVERGGTMWDLRRIGKEEVERVKGQKGRPRFELMDVTMAASYRADGHPGSHWLHKADRGTNDCVHWCLPGPIDVWNEMLMALMLRNSDLV